MTGLTAVFFVFGFFIVLFFYAIYLVIHIACLIYAHFHPEVKDDVLWKTDFFT